MARKGWAAALWVAVVAGPLLAAFIGARGPQRITVNLGPGDGPYVRGFAPHYEIDDKVATHWTTYDAAVAPPLTISGGPVSLSYRYARMFGETAQVEVGFAGRAVDRFEARGGTVLERTVSLGTLVPTPVEVSFKADSHERRDRGLKLDWIRLDVGPTARARLQGGARWRGVAEVLLLLAILSAAGWAPLASGLMVLPVSLVLTAGLLSNPWLTHRLLTALPETLLVVGIAGVALGRALVARGRAEVETVRTLTALCAAAFLIRIAAVNHPDFYYPDLRTHARLVEVVREAGAHFFVAPSTYIWEHGVWRTGAYGRTYAFPYTPAFHLPFTWVPLAYDTLITALKIGGVVVSLVPLVLVWVMARWLGASTLGAALMVLVPTYTSRLSFAFLPSLFGHAVDMAFLCWLLTRADRLGTLATFARGVAWVVAVQLAYISGVMNANLFLAALAVIEPPGTARERLRRGAIILGMGLLASAISVALYYRDFLGMVGDMLPRIGGAEGAVSRYPVQGFFAVAYSRTRDFFDGVYPILAAAGLFLLRGRTGYRVLLAWLVTYALLLFGRAKVPDVFLHGHETLWITPLVCLASGEALSRLAARDRVARIGAGLLLAVLAIQGLAWQWQAIAEQLGNAR
jgi:hypothetical protein